MSPTYQRHEFRGKSSEFAILIPVLNEGKRIQQQISSMIELNRIFDVFIVDGGSTDNALSLDFLRKSFVRELLVKQGPGRLSAQLRIGFSRVIEDQYKGVILIDGNGKDDFSAIPKFAEMIEQGWHFVQGSRFVPGGIAVNTPKIRWFAIRFLHAPILSLFSGFWFTDTTNGFRAYSREFLLDPRVQPLRDIFMNYELPYYLARMAPRLGFKVIEVPVRRSYPKSEVPSKIKGLKAYAFVLKDLLLTCLGYYDPK